MAILLAQAQTKPAQDSLKQHYDAAQSFQAAGNLQGAAVEYRQFISAALRRLAVARATVDDNARALALFEEALNLVPSDIDLRVDYADACRRAGDLRKAKSLADSALEAEPRNAKAHISLGRTLQHLSGGPDASAAGKQAAIEQFEDAVAAEPTFEHGLALASAYLWAKDLSNAARIFNELLDSFGSGPEVLLQIGAAYAQAGYPEQAITEFKSVIASNPKFPGAHYSLGAAYLVSASDALYPQAAEEFRNELANNPDDYLSRYQLGYIELSQHKLPEAETDLTRAAALDPNNPDTFVSLGQLYVETNRPKEAEGALRKAIALTADISRNHFQVQRAHYLLARLLLQSGREDEGKAEMQISQDLMQKSVLRDQGRDATGGMAQPAPGGRTVSADMVPEPPQGALVPEGPETEAVKQVAALERQLGAPIADSYNNLGAIAAGNRTFAEAIEDFQRAYHWNPSLEGLDSNWARAAISANQISEAVAPLERHLKAHPDDVWARSTLGTSFYLLRKYAEAAKTLEPAGAQLDSNPPLDYVYAISLLKSGQYDRGVERLKRLAAKNPDAAANHEALAEAYASHKDFTNAVAEFRQVVRLSPDDAGAKYNLATSLIELQQKDEAQRLLAGLIAQGWQDPHAYYTLGKLQLDQGNVADAVKNLETAAKLSPNSAPIHLELAAAYRKGSRNDDADRQMQLYESLRSEEAKPGAGKPE